MAYFCPVINECIPVIEELRQEGTRVLVACSGGVDSTVLLHLLQEEGLAQGVVHCHFSLRGKEADEDAQLVRGQAKERDLPFFYRQFNTRQFADQHKLSVQMAARQLRYQYFQQLMEEKKFTHLALGHHLQDSMETFLINLGRSTGLDGLTGIAPFRQRIVRPLIHCTQRQVKEYARERALTWREDSSNKDTHYLRNHLRHKVLPTLEQAFPHWERSFSKTLDHLRSQQQALHYFLDEKLAQHLKTKGEQSYLPLSCLQEKPYSEALLHHWLQPYGPWDWEALRHIPTGHSGKEWESPQYQLLEDREDLILSPKAAPGPPQQYWIQRSLQMLNTEPAVQFALLPIEGAHFRDAPPTEAYLDADKLRWPLQLRPVRKGDRFYPLGMDKPQKLSDFMINAKMNRLQKKQQWVLCSGTDIVWVVGQRIDHRYRVTDSTRTVYFVQLK